MKYFTADWHLGDERQNILVRPFESAEEQDLAIFTKFIRSGFEDGDELWHLGDVLYNPQSTFVLDYLRKRYPNSRFVLIKGNYDEDKLEILEQYFDEIYDMAFVDIDGLDVYLNHYPTECIDHNISMCGHIHGTWRVQHNILNVGVDTNYFRPYSEEDVKFQFNAMANHYDHNVFPYTYILTK